MISGPTPSSRSFSRNSIQSYPLSPVELCVVTFLGRTANGLNFCIDKSSCFERLDAVIRSATGVLVRVFTVEKRRVNGGVTTWVVQLCRQAQQHSPELLCCIRARRREGMLRLRTRSESARSQKSPFILAIRSKSTLPMNTKLTYTVSSETSW